MNPIKKTAIKTLNHVNRHKAAYVAGAVAITAIALQQHNLKLFTEFMVEKGIDPLEYFNPDMFAELNPTV